MRTACHRFQGETIRRLGRWVERRPDIVPPAVDETFHPQTKKQIKACRRKYALHFPYILNVSAWEPRKNVELLVTTYLKMKRGGFLPNHRLVLCGQCTYKYKRLVRMITKNKKRDIIHLGFIPDAHLPALYAGAEVFVFPSKYEGFGMPVLEARACGTRFVTTDIPELREAGGPGGIYVEPTEAGIRHGILAAIETPAPMVDRADLPTWEKSGGTLSRLLKQSVSG